MPDLSINVLFWNTGVTQRLENIERSRPTIERLANNLNEHGVETQLTYWDFSQVPVLENAIHVPFVATKYHRAEKLNMVIRHAKLGDFKNICQFDADIYLAEDAYCENFYETLKLKKDKYFLTGSVLDVQETEGVRNWIKTGVLPNENLQLVRRDIPGLGAFFVARVNDLFEIGGFDERFTVWGGEDDDMMERLCRNGLDYGMVNYGFLHLPHPRLDTDAHKTAEYARQVKIIREDKTIVRNQKV